MSEQGTIDRIKRMLRRAILRALPPCSDVVHIISASLDRPLALRERFVMKLHLAACKPCERYLEQSKFLRDAIDLMSGREVSDLFSGSLKEESRVRIREALRSCAASY